MPPIDLDRGVHIKHTRDGIAIYMYVGNPKDGYAGAEPGVFYNDHGNEVDPRLAKEAGFDVPTLLRERKKRERMASAAAAIEAEFRPEEATSETVAEKNGFKAVHIGHDRFNLIDPDGNVLNKKYLTRADALRVLDIVSVEKSAAGSGRGASTTSDEAPAAVGVSEGTQA